MALSVSLWKSLISEDDIPDSEENPGQPMNLQYGPIFAS